MARPAILPALAFLLAVLPAPAQEAVPRPAVAFDVHVADPASGRIRVAMTVSGNTRDEVRVAMPAWAPGAYRVVTYAKHVSSVAAVALDGSPLQVSAVDEQTWAVRTGRALAFTVTYEVAVEKTRLDPEQAYLAGPDTYLYLVHAKEAPCRVRFRMPEGWDVATGLRREGEDYVARDYDTFIDCPAQLGKFERRQFEADGATYEIVIRSKGPVDGAKFTAMCRTIVTEQNRMFGGPPFDRYVFLYQFRDAIGGRGLEHLNSTEIAMPYAAMRAEPRLAASITSHEYFHLWNVKRIRPIELGPFDYSGPVRSKALWFCEGVTSYFGDRALVRSGLWSEPQYLGHLGTEIETLQNNPDRLATSIESASETVWDRKDWPRVDYYNKGELLGLLIDLRIRTRTRGEKGLDDVLRHLWETYVDRPSKNGKGPIGVGFPPDGIVKALRAVSGEDWTDFHARYVAGVEELPYDAILSEAGLEPGISVLRSPDLGVDFRGTVVTIVPAGGAAEKAGLKPSDRILSLNGSEVNRTTFREEVARLRPGDEARLTVSRGEERIEIAVPVVTRDRTVCRLRRSASPTDLQQRILDGWIGKPRDF